MSLPYTARLFQRTRSLLLSLQGKGAVVAFLSQQALVSRKGGTWFSFRQALRLGFVPGQSLFVVCVGALGLSLVASAVVQHSFLLPVSQQLSLELPAGIQGAGPGLNWSRSPSAGRRDPHGERYNAQTVSGPLSQAFWLGLNFH